MKISGISIGKESPPFLIAEMSGNHNQSLDRSIKIVQAAAASGVHANKLQTYTPDTMTIDVKSDDFYIGDRTSPWYGRYLYELYEEAHAPWEWHQEIMDEADRVGLICFSTPFDESAVDFLEDLNIPAYKISSFENTDLPLIRKVAATGKPVLISCGLASLGEIEETVELTDKEKIKILKEITSIGNESEELWTCTICELEQESKDSKHLLLQHGLVCSNCFESSI